MPVSDFRYTYDCEVVSCYDGDSITAHVDMGCGLWRRNVKCRLFGINAPELRGETRNAGLEARNYLRSLLTGNPVILRTHKDKDGKYGRLLVTAWFKDPKTSQWFDANDLMIREGHAVEYKP